jgi:hypothetical protein
VVLCVWSRSYRVCPAPLPYRGKLLVHKGASLCSLPAAVHCGGGPTPWHSLTLTGLRKMSLWLLSPPSRLCWPGLLSIARLCLLLTLPIPLIITLVSVWYMYYLWSQYKMLIQKKKYIWTVSCSLHTYFGKALETHTPLTRNYSHTLWTYLVLV